MIRETGDYDPHREGQSRLFRLLKEVVEAANLSEQTKQNFLTTIIEKEAAAVGAACINKYELLRLLMAVRHERSEFDEVSELCTAFRQYVAEPIEGERSAKEEAEEYINMVMELSNAWYGLLLPAKRRRSEDIGTPQDKAAGAIAEWNKIWQSYYGRGQLLHDLYPAVAGGFNQVINPSRAFKDIEYVLGMEADMFEEQRKAEQALEKKLKAQGRPDPFSDIDIMRIDVAGMDVSNMNFDGLDMELFHMEGGKATNAKFTGRMSGRLTGANFTGAHFSDGPIKARLDGANLQGALFRNKRFPHKDNLAYRTIFKDADARGAQFIDVTIEDPRIFQGMIVDSNTRGIEINSLVRDGVVIMKDKDV